MQPMATSIKAGATQKMVLQFWTQRTQPGLSFQLVLCSIRYLFIKSGEVGGVAGGVQVRGQSDPCCLSNR